MAKKTFFYAAIAEPNAISFPTSMPTLYYICESESKAQMKKKGINMKLDWVKFSSEKEAISFLGHKPTRKLTA